MQYKVSVTRTSYASCDFFVEAENPEQAQELALEEAYNHQFSEHASDYETSAEEVK